MKPYLMFLLCLGLTAGCAPTGFDNPATFPVGTVPPPVTRVTAVTNGTAQSAEILATNITPLPSRTATAPPASLFAVKTNRSPLRTNLIITASKTMPPAAPQPVATNRTAAVPESKPKAKTPPPTNALPPVLTPTPATAVPPGVASAAITPAAPATRLAPPPPARNTTPPTANADPAPAPSQPVPTPVAPVAAASSPAGVASQPLAAPPPLAATATNLPSTPAAANVLTNPPGASMPLAVATNAMELLDNKHQLGPGDRVAYRVIEDQDQPQSLVIAESGEINIPYYGLVDATGKTCRLLAEDIKRLLEQNLYHQATVIIALETIDRERVSGKVYVTGRVNAKGAVDIPAGESFTVSKAILSAGGFSDFSDKKRVRLVRQGPEGKKTFVVNIEDVWEEGKLEADLEVRPDDLIVVPERLVNW